MDVVKGVGRVDSEADEDDVRIWVRQRSQTIVIFLASGIPKSQFDVFPVDLDIGNVVLENGWDIYL